MSRPAHDDADHPAALAFGRQRCRKGHDDLGNDRHHPNEQAGSGQYGDRWRESRHNQGKH